MMGARWDSVTFLLHRDPRSKLVRNLRVLFSISDYSNAFAKWGLLLLAHLWFSLNYLPSQWLFYTHRQWFYNNTDIISTDLLTNLVFFKRSISKHRLLKTGKGEEKSYLEMDQMHYYFTTFSHLPSSSHSSRGFCCLFRHRGSSQDVVFVLWLETKNGNMTFVNKAELKYQWYKSCIDPLYYSTDPKAYFCLKRKSITIWWFAKQSTKSQEPWHWKHKGENWEHPKQHSWLDGCTWKLRYYNINSQTFVCGGLFLNSRSCLWAICLLMKTRIPKPCSDLRSCQRPLTLI